MAHKDIRKEFEVKDEKTGEVRKYEAVGFLKDNKLYVNGDKMLRCVPDAIGEEDVKFLEKCVDQDWSRELWPYYLATSCRRPGRSRYVRSFRRIGDRWFLDNGWPADDWGHNCLVVRRIA